MEESGVRFSVNSPLRFEQLRSLFTEIKHDKEADRFRDPSGWVRLVPDDIKSQFIWPTPHERARWLAKRDSTVVAIGEPSRQLGARWDFYRVFEAIEEGDYDLLGCEMVGNALGEMCINPHGYPYGGVGPLIALAEAFGLTVAGVNEYGRYQSREELLGGRGAS